MNISKYKNFSGKIKEFSSEFQDNYVKNLLENNGFWRSQSNNENHSEYFIIDYENEIEINAIFLSGTDSGKMFPKNFRVEISSDSQNWEVIHTERNFSFKNNSIEFLIDIPLTRCRYLKVFILDLVNNNENYYCEIAGCKGVILGITNVKVSSISDNKNEGLNLFDGRKDTYWESEVRKNSKKDTILIDLEKIFHVYRIILGSYENGFPGKFTIEGSSDKEIWKPLLQERNFIAQPYTKYFWNIDIISLRYIRIEVTGVKIEDKKFITRISGIDVFAAIFKPNHTHNIGDLTPYASIFQAGIIKLAKDGEESIGAVVQGNDRRLRPATNLFPGIVQLGEDREESKGVVVQANDSRLKKADELNPGIVRLGYDRENKEGVVVQCNDSRLREATEKSYGIVKICHDGLESGQGVVKGDDSRLKKGTTEFFGICRLAENGENSSECVVQADDKRLRDATTTYKGIMKFASDGEDKEGVAVQGNDIRLKDATTNNKGIIELAENGEERSGVVVQGSDKRLKSATTKNKGIVELAENGESKEGVVVQGNDKRLIDATTGNKGIVELAKSGESKEGVVVQGNDKRLQKATTLNKGIVELAENGENRENVVVQGNDKRLQKATEFSSGIVELAENGESKEGVVVQGSDKRLRQATEKNPGIVTLGKDGQDQADVVVQGNDKRLSDLREPLPHSHDYAKKTHDFNSHSGTISIKSDKSEAFSEILPPLDLSSVIYGLNTSKKPGAIGVTGVSGSGLKKSTRTYGVFGDGGSVGVRGQATGDKGTKGCGVLGLSRFGAGGVFSSEHSFSLVADGYGKIKDFDNSINFIGNGEALYVNGNSKLNGKIEISNTHAKQKYPVNIVELFEVDETEFISVGDLLVVSDNGDSTLAHSRDEYNKSVIGVVSGNPTLVLNNSDKEKKLYPVTLTGKVMCKVDARNNPISPGDLIVTSNTPGCGMTGEIDSFKKIGTVLGKALDKLEDGIGLIPVFIAHS